MKIIHYIGGMVVVLGILTGAPMRAQTGQDEDEVTYRYEEVVFSELIPAFPLPEDVSETSGLIFYRDMLWTHNDSGGEPAIYAIDTANGNILQVITLDGASNVDWEDIAQDRDYVYVGDFGNNSGNRNDLRIYRIGKADIPAEGDASVDFGIIEFHFSDQEDFDNKNMAHDFDCESMIVDEGIICLFSKNWADGNTRLYKLPAVPGTHEAKMVQTLEVGGLVTSADIDTASGKVILTGYRNFYPFMVLLTGFQAGSPIDTTFRKIEFPQVPAIQGEGVAFIDSTRVFVSAEKSETEQQVYSFGLTDWEEMNAFEIEQPALENWDPIMFIRKKNSERYVAVDVSPFRHGVFHISLEKLSGRQMTFPGYIFDRHMGKSYIKLDVLPLPVNKYKVILGTGGRKSEKEIFLDD